MEDSRIAALLESVEELSARATRLLKSYHAPGAHDQGTHGKGGGSGRGGRGGGGGKQRGKAGSKPIPDDGPATKARNSIASQYGGKKSRGRIQSNPYSNVQYSGADIPSSKVPKLKSDLESQGWKMNNAFLNKDAVKGGYANFDKGKMSIRVGPSGSILVIGTKKAKRSSLPQFD